MNGAAGIRTDGNGGYWISSKLMNTIAGVILATCLSTIASIVIWWVSYAEQEASQNKDIHTLTTAVERGQLPIADRRLSVIEYQISIVAQTLTKIEARQEREERLKEDNR